MPRLTPSSLASQRWEISGLAQQFVASGDDSYLARTRKLPESGSVHLMNGFFIMGRCYVYLSCFIFAEVPSSRPTINVNKARRQPLKCPSSKQRKRYPKTETASNNPILSLTHRNCRQPATMVATPSASSSARPGIPIPSAMSSHPALRYFPGLQSHTFLRSRAQRHHGRNLCLAASSRSLPQPASTGSTRAYADCSKGSPDGVKGNWLGSPVIQK